MWPALFFSMQLVSAVYENATSPTIAVVHERAEKGVSNSNGPRPESAAHNPLRKVPRIAGKALVARPANAPQRD